MPNWANVIQPYKEQLLADLEGLLHIPSVLDEETASPEAPFGQGIREALDYMLDLGRRDGFMAKDVDHYAGHLELGHGQKILGILSHLDVVPANPDQWETDPFVPVIKDGKLYARGALDDKGPTLMGYYAAKILKDEGYHFKQRIRLIYGTDEENDWRGVAHYFKKETMPDFGLVPDGIFPMIYAEKGVVNLDLTKKVTSDQLLSLEVGRAYNMVPDLAVAELQYSENLEETFKHYLTTHRLEGRLTTSDGKQRLTLKGKSAHGSGPAQGINAGLHLVHFLTQADLDEEVQAFLNFVDRTLWEDTQGEQLGLAYQDKELGATTVNTATLQVKNSLASIGLNWRYPASQNFDKGWQTLQTLADHKGFDLSLHSHQKPSHADLDRPETQILLETYRKHTGDQTPPLAIGGITYGRGFDAGITYGPAFLGKPATLHQANEFIELDDLWKALEIYLDGLYQLVTEEGELSED